MSANSQQPRQAPCFPGADIALATEAETIDEFKRALGKELYKLELGLSRKLKINGKPCACFVPSVCLYTASNLPGFVAGNVGVGALPVSEIYKRRTKGTTISQSISFLCYQE